MFFKHAAEIWRDFPELIPGVLAVSGITGNGPADDGIARFTAVARSRLNGTPERAARDPGLGRAFARMGLKPTRYRCASESLLRRFRPEGALPRLHPLVDLCNAVALAYAIPVAVLDAATITGRLEVRYATGDEDYLMLSGDVEHPAAREVIFAGQAHARRWTNRQSGLSAVRDPTTGVSRVRSSRRSARMIPDTTSATRTGPAGTPHA
jgi:DNA/RNA-binding domain of Phe-tRNA-synthetase-like protein